MGEAGAGAQMRFVEWTAGGCLRHAASRSALGQERAGGAAGPPCVTVSVPARSGPCVVRPCLEKLTRNHAWAPQTLGRTAMQWKTRWGGDEDSLRRALVALIAVHAITAATAFANAEATASAANSKELETDARACMDLQGRIVGGSRIVAAMFAYPPFGARWMNSTRTAVTLVPFCRLEGYANPSPRSHSEFEVWLPARAAWNGRFLGVGAGGSMGDVNRPDLIGAVSRGFAAVATDNGHRSAGPRDGNQWALGEWERVVDFGYRAQKLATAAAKAAVSAYYGQPPKYSYFAGCSQGGQKALMAAQHHPSDYDGILAAPGVQLA